MERHTGKQLRSNIPINSKKFINLEKKIVLDCIIELVNQRFLPKQKNVRNMADSLCNAWNVSRVGPQ